MLFLFDFLRQNPILAMALTVIIPAAAFTLAYLLGLRLLVGGYLNLLLALLEWGLAMLGVVNIISVALSFTTPDIAGFFTLGYALLQVMLVYIGLSIGRKQLKAKISAQLQPEAE